MDCYSNKENSNNREMSIIILKLVWHTGFYSVFLFFYSAFLYHYRSVKFKSIQCHIYELELCAFHSIALKYHNFPTDSSL